MLNTFLAQIIATFENLCLVCSAAKASLDSYIHRFVDL